jgi:hypothetical protein
VLFVKASVLITTLALLTIIIQSMKAASADPAKALKEQ